MEGIKIFNEAGNFVGIIVTKKSRYLRQYSWKLIAANGKVIADGKGFNNMENLNKSLRAVKRAFRYLKPEHIE